jgi:hypothetical protein
MFDSLNQFFTLVSQFRFHGFVSFNLKKQFRAHAGQHHSTLRSSAAAQILSLNFTTPLFDLQSRPLTWVRKISSCSLRAMLGNGAFATKERGQVSPSTRNARPGADFRSPGHANRPVAKT